MSDTVLQNRFIQSFNKVFLSAPLLEKACDGCCVSVILPWEIMVYTDREVIPCVSFLIYISMVPRVHKCTCQFTSSRYIFGPWYVWESFPPLPWRMEKRGEVSLPSCWSSQDIQKKTKRSVARRWEGGEIINSQCWCMSQNYLTLPLRCQGRHWFWVASETQLRLVYRWTVWRSFSKPNENLFKYCF